MISSLALLTQSQLARTDAIHDGGIDPPDDTWTETYAFDPVAQASSPGWDGYTVRQVIPASALPAGTKVRLTLRSGNGGAAVIAAAYLQLQAASGDAWDFLSTPLPVKVSGATSFTIPDGFGSKVTDAVELAVPGGVAAVLSVYFTSGSVTRFDGHADWPGFYKSASDAATVDATGYATGSEYLIQKVEVVLASGGGDDDEGEGFDFLVSGATYTPPVGNDVNFLVED